MANAYFSGWPYTRLLDTELISSWGALESFSACRFLISRDGDRPVACLHGELRDDVAIVHLLAVRDRERQAGADLLAEFESLARDRKIERLLGPHGPTISYYGGYVLGFNPYHPHWATVATDAYILAGCDVSRAGCILTLPLNDAACDSSLPAAYEMRIEPAEEERATSTFKIELIHRDRVVGHTFASYCADLPSLKDGSIGHIKYVETDSDHRGRGLGRAMVSASAAELRRLGASEVTIVTNFENAPALRAYENAGFRRRHLILGVSKQLTG